MDMKKWAPIISMISVAVMFIWGMFLPQAGGWGKSWIAVFIGGIIIAILSILNKDKDNKDGE